MTWRFWLARILPVGLFMALTLHFGNIVYLYLTVSFIQMLKVRPKFRSGFSEQSTSSLPPCPALARIAA